MVVLVLSYYCLVLWVSVWFVLMCSVMLCLSVLYDVVCHVLLSCVCLAAAAAAGDDGDDQLVYPPLVLYCLVFTIPF